MQGGYCPAWEPIQLDPAPVGPEIAGEEGRVSWGPWDRRPCPSGLAWGKRQAPLPPRASGANGSAGWWGRD